MASNNFSGKTLLIVNTCNRKKEFLWEKIGKMDIHVIVLNETVNWADTHVDNWITADTSKHEECIEKIDSFLKEHPEITIDGVMTFCEDVVLLTSKITEHLGVIGIPFQISQMVRDKYRFRTFCQQHNIQVPQHILVKSAKDIMYAIQNFHFPLIMKPTHGSSSHYVIKVDNEKKLLDTYDYLKKNISLEIATSLVDGLDLMVEEYIKGDEVDIDVLLQNKELKFLSITDNFATREPYFIESGEGIPTRLSQKKQTELVDMTMKTLHALKLENGCFHYEAKSTENGSVPIELNLRMGGGDVWPYMKGVWGVDILEYAMKIALGIPFQKIETTKPLQYMLGQTLMIDQTGILRELHYDEELNKKPYLEKIYLAKKAGDYVATPPESYDYLGWVTVSGKSAVEAQKNLEDAKRYIHYTITPIQTESDTV